MKKRTATIMKDGDGFTVVFMVNGLPRIVDGYRYYKTRAGAVRAAEKWETIR